MLALPAPPVRFLRPLLAALLVSRSVGTQHSVPFGFQSYLKHVILNLLVVLGTVAKTHWLEQRLTNRSDNGALIYL